MTLFDFEKEPGSLTKLALFLPSLLFRSVASTRAKLYEHEIFPVVKTELPVISVGNLTTGGTGKTPIVSYLTERLTNAGYNVSIVSRGYGATEKGPALVPASGDAASALRFGDEPFWLAGRHPKSKVVIGAQRPEAIRFLRESVLQSLAPKSVVIADDAFQHRRLRREIDVVVIDASAPDWHYEALPLGRMREGFESLSRAHFVFLSKVNQAREIPLARLREKLKNLSAVHGFKVVEFRVALEGVAPFENPNAAAKPLSSWVAGGGRAKVVLLSGLARPQSFEDLLKKSEAVEILEHFKFADHAKPTDVDLQKVKAAAAKADCIIMTEKDAVKLQGWRPEKPCFVTRLRAEPLNADDLGGFYEAVRRLS